MCPETFLLGWFNVCLLHLVLVHVHLLLHLHLASPGDTLRYYPNIKHPDENKTKREKIHRSKTTCQLQILGKNKVTYYNSVIQYDQLTCFVNLSPTKVGQWHHDEAESPEDGEQHRALGGLRHVADIPVPAMQCIYCTAVPVICL